MSGKLCIFPHAVCVTQNDRFNPLYVLVLDERDQHIQNVAVSCGVAGDYSFEQLSVLCSAVEEVCHLYVCRFAILPNLSVAGPQSSLQSRSLPLLQDLGYHAKTAAYVPRSA